MIFSDFCATCITDQYHLLAVSWPLTVWDLSQISALRKDSFKLNSKLSSALLSSGKRLGQGVCPFSPVQSNPDHAPGLLLLHHLWLVCVATWQILITIGLFMLLFLTPISIFRNFRFLSSMRMSHLALQNVSFIHFLYMHQHLWERPASKNQSRWKQNKATGIKLPLNLRLCVLSRQYSNSVWQLHCIVFWKITLIQIIRTTEGQQVRFH